MQVPLAIRNYLKKLSFCWRNTLAKQFMKTHSLKKQFGTSWSLVQACPVSAAVRVYGAKRTRRGDWGIGDEESA
jgi:hypothetical protein